MFAQDVYSVIKITLFTHPSIRAKIPTNHCDTFRLLPVISQLVSSNCSDYVLFYGRINKENLCKYKLKIFSNLS